MATEAEKSVAAARGVRGPSYPSMNVEEAIAKAQQFWAAEKRNAAPIEVAAKNWGYSPTSSSGKVVIAALLHFGLLEDSGSGSTRMVKLTGRALDVLLDPDSESPRRTQAIQDAVQSPRLYAEILAKWPAQELPSDQTLRFYLLREKSFNEGSISAFIKDFRASISFAKLDKTPTIEKVSTDQPPDNPGDESAQPIKEWPVQAVQESRVGTPGAGAASGGTSSTTKPALGVKQDTFSLDEGQVVLQFPEKMSQDSYADFKDWIELQLRRIKRSVLPPDQQS